MQQLVRDRLASPHIQIPQFVASSRQLGQTQLRDPVALGHTQVAKTGS